MGTTTAAGAVYSLAHAVFACIRGGQQVHLKSRLFSLLCLLRLFVEHSHT